MAGGKETPRQKMIGMMYLVLTALLALNVSKQIVAAFVTINDKLDSSGQIIDNSTESTYGTFDSKRAALKAQKGNMDIIDLWQGKAMNLKTRTKQTIHFILSQSNEMIKKAEGGKSWIKEEDDNGNILELESLLKISAMDNYDIPTNMFIGGNPMKPKPAGLAILDSIHAYRDYVTELMGTYKRGDKQFSFESPEDPTRLKEALGSANPEDTSKIAQFYRSMTIPEMIEVKDGGSTKKMPWPSAMFDHAPIVAAAAMMTSVKVDVLNAESSAAEFMLSKVDAPTFNFNKIEPLAFARTGYINQGDSLDLRVMIAAYDSTEVPPIKYGINDSIPENWEKTSGSIPITGDASGSFKVTGSIGVKEKGELNWKPWEFKYTVGKPSGAISLPEMNVLYRGYQNKVKGAVSGYTDYSLSMSNGSISKSGDVYIAKPGGGREATISITGIAADGSKASVGKEEFRVRNLPNPTIKLGSLWDGAEASSASIKAMTRLFAKYPPEIPLAANFSVVSYKVKITGLLTTARGNGSNLNGAAKSLLKQARSGATILFETDVKGPDGKIRRKNGAITVK
jgi:hypothetical protein